MVLPTSPPNPMSVGSNIYPEFGITALTTKYISRDLFPLVGGTASTQCFLGASFSGKSGGTKVGYSTIKGTATDTGQSIAVDSAGNIYITGLYQSTTTVPINTFGATPTASGVSLPITTGVDAFVIKWLANGTVAGYTNIKGNGTDTGQSITVDSAGNIYITGRYTSTTTVPINTFGTAPAASGVSLPITTGTDAFVIKWNAVGGTVAGYSTIKGSGTDIGYGIAVDSSQNIYITGQYQSTAAVQINTFGTAPTFSGLTLPITLGLDAFVIKWLANGTVAGYTNLRGTGTATDTGQSIAVDSAGNIYITGQYNTGGTAPINTFGTAPAASGVSMPGTTGVDAFVIKWNGSGGTVAGYTNIKGSSADIGYGIAVDSSQNIYITGNYNSITTVPINTFGTAPAASGVSLPITTGTDAFVIKWNAVGGTVAGYSTIKGSGTDIGYGIAVDSSQNIYITGQYQSTAVVPINTFGTAPSASGFNLPTVPGVETRGFVIKWSGSTGAVLAWTNIGGAGTNAGNGIAVDSSQNLYVAGQYQATAVVPINTFGTAPVASGVSMPITTGIDAFVIKWIP